MLDFFLCISLDNGDKSESCAEPPSQERGAVSLDGGGKGESCAESPSQEWEAVSLDSGGKIWTFGSWCLSKRTKLLKLKADALTLKHSVKNIIVHSMNKIKNWAQKELTKKSSTKRANQKSSTKRANQKSCHQKELTKEMPSKGLTKSKAKEIPKELPLKSKRLVLKNWC